MGSQGVNGCQCSKVEASGLSKEFLEGLSGRERLSG
jgi:hypothetical protein